MNARHAVLALSAYLMPGEPESVGDGRPRP